MIYKAHTTTVIARNEMTKQSIQYWIAASGFAFLAMTKRACIYPHGDIKRTNELIELFNKIKGDNPHPSIKTTNELIKWVTPAPYPPHLYEQKGLVIL
jgi:hypothetical protein